MSVRVARMRPALRREGRDGRDGVLDAAAAVLVADPSASLAEVAEAAGIGRTTLHKHWATRDELLRAVAHRALDRWEDAIGAVADAPDGSLLDLAEAMISVGPYLSFLWRNPSFDHSADIGDRARHAEARVRAVLERARQQGRMRADVPPYWLLHSFYALVYVAGESVADGDLAPRSAPDMVVSTFLRGVA
jgi:AcrR family transcriptional regulator